MVVHLHVCVIIVVLAIVHGRQPVPDLLMDQPVRAQPGPSFLDSNDYDVKVKDYAARAMEILTIRARSKKRKSKHGTKSFKTATCSPLFQKVSDTHTMCLRDIGREVKLSQNIKDVILRQHNKYRSRVSPTSSNMQKMVWDDSLAKIAGKWSRQCRRGHDNGPDRASPDLPGVHVGQNAAYGYRNWQSALEAWHNEAVNFEYSTGSLTGAVVGHYTQMVAWRSARVGCGQSDCPNSPYRRHFVCNYAVGQMNDDPKVPYRKGDRCGDCPDKCDETGTMCDCGGKLCLNGGKINLNTCECKCPNIYTGEVCETLQCPVRDPWYCGGQWPEDYCQQFANVPQECPYMCRTCMEDSPVTPEPRKCRLRCKNGGKVDVTKCTCTCPEGFTGRRCERKARLCGGKTCVNGGQLNTQTCDCECPLGFTGDRCEVRNEICGGKLCENRGRLNRTSCECLCPDGYGGSMCQTVLPDCKELACQNGGSFDEETCTCKCLDKYTGQNCEKEKCTDISCLNGGQIHFEDCSCQCAEGYRGASCELKIITLSGQTGCDKKCENGGLLDRVTCRCWCPSPFIGERCHEVECPETDQEVCENFPVSYCADFFLMRHMCPFKCSLCSPKDCDPDKWFCNENYIQPHLCRVVAAYCPRFCGLC